MTSRHAEAKVNTAMLRYALFSAKSFSRAAQNVRDRMERQTVIRVEGSIENPAVRVLSYRDDIGTFRSSMQVLVSSGMGRVMGQAWRFESTEANATFRALKDYEGEEITLRFDTEYGANQQLSPESGGAQRSSEIMIQFRALDGSLLYQITAQSMTERTFDAYKNKYWIEGDAAIDGRALMTINSETFISALKTAAILIKSRASEGSVHIDLENERLVIESKAGIIGHIRLPLEMNPRFRPRAGYELFQGMFWLMQSVAATETLELDFRSDGQMSRLNILAGDSQASFTSRKQEDCGQAVFDLLSLSAVADGREFAVVDIEDLKTLCDRALANKLPYTGIYLMNEEKGEGCFTQAKLGFFAGSEIPYPSVSAAGPGQLKAGLISEKEENFSRLASVNSSSLVKTENLYRVVTALEKDLPKGTTEIVIQFPAPIRIGDTVAAVGSGPMSLSYGGASWWIESHAFGNYDFQSEYGESADDSDLGNPSDYESDQGMIAGENTPVGSFVKDGRTMFRLTWISPALELVKMTQFNQRMRVKGQRLFALSTLKSKRMQVMVKNN
jgi:hypothetical protein